MKLDKQTIMLFGGGLVLGYLICKFMAKSDAPVGFSADGLMRAGDLPNSKPHIGANPIGSSGTHSNPISSSPLNAPRISRRRN